MGGGWDLPERVAAVLSRLGLGDLPLDRPVGTVSGGEATRVSLAGLELRPPDILLLDEPTNHLDLDAMEALESALRSHDGAVLVVSHGAAFLEAIGVQRQLTLVT